MLIVIKLSFYDKYTVGLRISIIFITIEYEVEDKDVITLIDNVRLIVDERAKSDCLLYSDGTTFQNVWTTILDRGADK